MIYHNAVKRILTAPTACDRRTADRFSLLFRYLNLSIKGLSLVKIHGESGKSACATMLGHALSANGYRTGAVTTPFSHSMTECITVDGRPISMDDFTDCVSRVCEATATLNREIYELPPLSEEETETLTDTQKTLYAYQKTTEGFSLSADEILLASALCYFVKSGCQIAIVEVPTGPRGNAYRLPLAPLVSIVTSTEDPAIAKTLCGALDRDSGETVSAMQDREITRIISDKCASINCRLTVPIKNDFYLTELAANRLGLFYKGKQYSLNSGAFYQALNLLTVLEALTALKRNGFSVDHATATFQPLFGSAGVPLQFTTVSLSPTIITDFADTPARRMELAKSLSYHKQISQSPVTLIVPDSEDPDEQMAQPFVEQGFSVIKIIRGDMSNPIRTMKPIVKTLDPSGTLVITGPRTFVYELHRALLGLLP